MKKWYTSKSLWIAFIGFIYAGLQVAGVTDSPLSPEAQAMVLSIIMFLLRLVTKEPLEWQKK